MPGRESGPDHPRPLQQRPLVGGHPRSWCGGLGLGTGRPACASASPHVHPHETDSPGHPHPLLSSLGLTVATCTPTTSGRSSPHARTPITARLSPPSHNCPHTDEDVLNPFQSPEGTCPCTPSMFRAYRPGEVDRKGGRQEGGRAPCPKAAGATRRSEEVPAQHVPYTSLEFCFFSSCTMSTTEARKDLSLV